MADVTKIVSKKAKIDKANAVILGFIAVASFVVVFSLVSTRYLINQFSYQVRVQSAQDKSIKALEQDKTAANDLVKSYERFNDETTNIIGGTVNGENGSNGDNAKIVLDALPSVYDYPALITSVQSLISQTQGVVTESISGTDVGTASTSATGAASTTATTSTTATSTPPATSTSAPSTPIAMPFTFSVQGSYAQMQQVITTFQESIQPMQILSISINGSDQTMTMNVSAQSYYLPASGFSVNTENVK
jgi:hypothetical protein